MPDITMCQNDWCSKAIKCERHEKSGTKPSAYRQSYAAFAPKDGECSHFVPTAPQSHE